MNWRWIVLMAGLGAACFPEQPLVPAHAVEIVYSCDAGMHDVTIDLSSNGQDVLLGRVDFLAGSGDAQWAVYLDLTVVEQDGSAHWSLQGVQDPRSLGTCAQGVTVVIFDPGGQQSFSSTP